MKKLIAVSVLSLAASNVIALSAYKSCWNGFASVGIDVDPVTIKAGVPVSQPIHYHAQAAGISSSYYTLYLDNDIVRSGSNAPNYHERIPYSVDPAHGLKVNYTAPIGPPATYFTPGTYQSSFQIRMTSPITKYKDCDIVAFGTVTVTP